MQVNGARRCPVCNKEPVICNDSSFDEKLIVLRCPDHGYVAMGDSLDDAIKHWNQFLNHEIRCTTHQSVLDPGPLTSSPCLYCQKNTEGVVYNIPEHYYVECKECHLIKYERKEDPHKKYTRDIYDQ